jgi:hypothetical protein
MACGVARGVSLVIEGYLEVWVKRTAFTITLYRYGVHFVTHVSMSCKPLDSKQYGYTYTL